MTTYSNTLKLDSLPLFEIMSGGYKPAIKVIYYEEDRPRSGQVYPRSL